MRNHFRASTICAIAVCLVLPFLIACAGHATSGSPPLATPPDLNGVWSAPFTPDISKTLGHQPPFTPYAAELFKNQHTFRIIHTDGRSHPQDVDPTWFGDSIGRWEGDTLVVDTVGLNDRTWLDTAGHEHSDQLHLAEKFQKTGNDNIKWTVTFEDPKFYTEPWSITLPIARQNTEIMSYSCEENEKDRAHLRRTKK